MFDSSSEIFGTSIDLFLNKYGDALEKVFKKEKHFRHVQNIVVFCEWFGAKSFAGNHKPWDKKDIVMFDVNLHKKGLMGPKEFLGYFGHLDIAEVVYQGNFGTQLVENVRNGQIDIESKYEVRSEIPEGIICKGGKGHDLWMCKIKTAEYMNCLLYTSPSPRDGLLSRMPSSA